LVYELRSFVCLNLRKLGSLSNIKPVMDLNY
jgi:hypothetical protein